MNTLKSIKDIRNISELEKNEYFKDKNIKELLLFFMDGDYLFETIKVPTKNIRILRQNSILRKYKFLEKNYVVEIDIKNRIIKHNCLYWLHKCVNQYKFCKHVGKIFLIIYEEDAKEILKDIILNDWKFDIYDNQ